MTRPNVFVEIAFNAGYSTAATSRVWTDVTSYVKTAESIAIRYGRQDEFATATPNTCTLTLNNSDGRFTPGKSSSPYYPNVKIGRPLRVSVALLTSGDNGTFEANATGWSGTNASANRSTLQFHSGTAALLVASTSAADMSAQSASGTSGIPVTPNTAYRASAWYRRAGAARTADLRVDWYDAAGVAISTDISASITDSTTWQQIRTSVTSPSNAAYARVRAYWTAAGAAESHYIDDVRFDSPRFTGYIDEWPLEWPGIVSTFATSTVSATSRMARLGLDDKLRSVVEEEILRDSPLAYYTFGEAEGAAKAAESSGRGGDAASAITTTLPTFGTETGPATDGLTSVTFPSATGPRLRAGGYSATLNGVGFWLACSGTLTSAVQILRITDPGAAGAALRVNMFPAGPDSLALNFAGAPDISFPFACDGTARHVFVQQSGANVNLYIDGALVGTGAATMGAFKEIYVGPDAPGSGINVTLAHLALYDTAPTAARIADHALSGSSGFATESAAARLARYAAYARIASSDYSFSSAALTPMAHIDATGQAPIELMQKVEATDGGVLYDSRDGLLTYRDRAVRYTATAVVTVDVNAGEVEADYAPRLDRSSLENKVTATLADGTYSVTAENTTSSGEYGAAGPSDLELATTSADEAHAAAWWRVNTYSDPAARAPELGVQIEALSVARQALLLGVRVSDKITATNLYGQSDATTKSFFVEGYAETITDSRHRIEFNVTPTTGYDVWVVEDAIYGAYDTYPTAY